MFFNLKTFILINLRDNIYIFHLKSFILISGIINNFSI
jgi:hypothetical protein